METTQAPKGSVDLIWLGGRSDLPRWELGDITCVDATPTAVHAVINKRLSITDAHAWLFWDSALGAPDPLVVNELLKLPGQVWHSGLKLGTCGMPGIIDFIAPTWMLNRDPDENILATSWRLSLRACLMHIEVLRQMGNIRPEFESLEAASLELGHRLVNRGVVTRHTGQLVKVESSNAPLLPFRDELRFAYYRFGNFWSKWALGRAVLTGYVPVMKALRSSREVFRDPLPSRPAPFKQARNESLDVDFEAKVSVLIPTLSRQQYLRTLLDQLRRQTIRPFEIIVVDQTPPEDRDTQLSFDFADLPLKVLYLDRPGQCSSRNAGLKETTGDYVLFIDDDDEIPPDLIEAHLRSLKSFSADVSCGVAEEKGSGPLPEEFTYTRISDVFPTNNSLVKIEALQKSGLFDLAFERGQRADHDLGMRIYLSGMLMVLNHEIGVFHHRAPDGGLRTHKARVVTYASSRQKINLRHLPSVTELYLALRYFSPRQLREMLWLRAFGTLSIRGHKGKRFLKIFAGLACLPDTIRRIRKEHLQAHAMCAEFPRISSLVD
jgi:glycosyltransferase involved in cell wall biosynthesis